MKYKRIFKIRTGLGHECAIFTFFAFLFEFIKMLFNVNNCKFLQFTFHEFFQHINQYLVSHFIMNFCYLLFEKY